MAKFLGPIFEKLGYSIFGPNANPLINYIVQENELKELDFFTPKNLAWRDQVELFLKNIDLQRSIFIQTETLWGRLAPRLGKNPSLRERALDLLKALRDQFSGHDMKIILHLRRADGYYESQFGQSIKAGGAKSLQHILDGDGLLAVIKEPKVVVPALSDPILKKRSDDQLT